MKKKKKKEKRNVISSFVFLVLVSIASIFLCHIKGTVVDEGNKGYKLANIKRRHENKFRIPRTGECRAQQQGLSANGA